MQKVRDYEHSIPKCLYQTLPLKAQGIYAEGEAEKLQEPEVVGDSKEALTSRQNRSGNTHKLTEAVTAHTRPAGVQTRQTPALRHTSLP